MDRAHKKLDIWKESVDLAVEIYRVTEAFPKSEVYGLTSQMRRAVVSIASNIAEGAARSTRKEFIQFLMISRGSLSELDTQLEIARRLQYLPEGVFASVNERLNSIGAKLAGLMSHLLRREM